MKKYQLYILAISFSLVIGIPSTSYADGYTRQAREAKCKAKCSHGNRECIDGCEDLPD